jgi:hypothetical protein
MEALSRILFTYNSQKWELIQGFLSISISYIKIFCENIISHKIYLIINSRINLEDELDPYQQNRILIHLECFHKKFIKLLFTSWLLLNLYELFELQFDIFNQLFYTRLE